jgi:NitT/TauT family transport system substrate-binding protein
MKRRDFLGVAGAATSFSLLADGCGHRQHQWPLRIGINDWIGYQIILAAQPLELLKKRDLQVDFIYFNNLQDATRALYRGGLDACFTTLWDLLQQCRENEQLRPVVLWVTNISAGSDGIVARPTFSSLLALRGKRIASKLGTINQLILLEALQNVGLQPQDLQVLNLSNEIAVNYLRTGKIDGAVLWQPLLSEIATEIGGKVVHDTGQLQSLVIDVLATSPGVLKARSEELQRLLWVWLDVMEKIQRKPKQVFSALEGILERPATKIYSDYQGVTPGTLYFNLNMFSQARPLTAEITKIIFLAQKDPNHPKALRNGIEVDNAFTLTSLKLWKTHP